MVNHFLVFLGGTGAKCAEAFVHMAAAGAVAGPDTTFHILTMDVDQTNGNRVQALSALGRYALLREQFPATGQFAGSSLFGPKLIHYDWHITLPTAFEGGAGVNCLHAMRTQNSPDEETLLGLFYTDEELSFDFTREGFHAIPAIGAPVMRYILDDVGEAGAMGDFLSALRVEAGVNTRLTVVGSIFGGTGACGIPAITRFFKEKTEDIAMAGNLLSTGVLVLPYYHFAEPDQEDDLGVRARKFYNNARGALAFYRDMEKELGFESLYLIGSPMDYPMGSYQPGMEHQKNPPTPVEWEAALAIAHTLTMPPDPEHPRTRQFIKAMPGLLQGESITGIKVTWESLSLNIRDRMGTMARFIAAYMGYYQDYMAGHRDAPRRVKPFYGELLKGYMDTIESETKAFEALSGFLEEMFAWLKMSLSYDILTQTCFTPRMIQSAGYPAKALHALIAGAPAPHFSKVEDALFDGIRPLKKDEADRIRRNAGLFIHGLYAHCAP